MRKRSLAITLVALIGWLPAQGDPKAPAPTAESAKPAVAADTKKAPEPKYLAIVGGEVHTATGPSILGATVLVRDDKIVDIGRDVRVPEGATIIDAAGRHVSPGFVAIFSSGINGNGGDGSNEADRGADRVDPFDRMLFQALALGITTVQTVPGGGGGFFGGGAAFQGSQTGRLAGVISKSTFGTLEGYEVRQPSALLLEYRRSSVVEAEKTKKVLREAVAYRAARQAFLAKVLAGEKDVKPPTVKGDPANFVKVLDGELPLFVRAEDADDLRACLDLAKEFSLQLTLVGAREAWTIPGEIARGAASVVLIPRGEGDRGTRPYRDVRRLTPHGWSIENGATLLRHGVDVAAMSMSTGTAQTQNGLSGRDIFGLPFEAAYLVRGGCSDLDALRAVTAVPARLLGVENRLGTLEIGKDADILVMDFGPLDYRAFVDEAIVNGVVRYRRSEHALHAHIRTNRRSGLGTWVPWGTWPGLEPKAPRSN